MLVNRLPNLSSKMRIRVERYTFLRPLKNQTLTMIPLVIGLGSLGTMVTWVKAALSKG